MNESERYNAENHSLKAIQFFFSSNERFQTALDEKGTGLNAVGYLYALNSFVGIQRFSCFIAKYYGPEENKKKYKQTHKNNAQFLKQHMVDLVVGNAKLLLNLFISSLKSTKVRRTAASEIKAA